MRLRYAIITTRNRPEDYSDCVESIMPQVDAVYPVFHVPPGERPPDYVSGVVRGYDIFEPADRDYSWPGFYAPDVLVLDYPYVAGYGLYCEDPPNISRMWNLGLDSVHEHAKGEPYDVAVLNDDAIVPPDWFDRVVSAMRHKNAAAGAVRRSFDPRMAGYAFVLDGTKGLRADERFQWWYGDDDLQRQAEQAGGVAFARGQDVEHRHPNSTTVGVLAKIAEADALRYKEKWT